MHEVSYLRLGLNIDHVATLRNARGGVHPDPVKAAHAAIKAGADGITAHLREDRRHIRDDDIARLMAELDKPLNLEMAATDEMVRIASKMCPHACCLVPERREERTTEGGLDVAGSSNQLRLAVARLKEAGIRVSMFIAPDPVQIEASSAVGAPVIEIHTGAWCEAIAAEHSEAADEEFNRIVVAARLGRTLGLEVHAGHGLTYASAGRIATIPELSELNIGHFLIGEAVFDGLPNVIRQMRSAMDRGRLEAGRSA